VAKEAVIAVTAATTAATLGGYSLRRWRLKIIGISASKFRGKDLNMIVSLL
jgi:hypothetical protein